MLNTIRYHIASYVILILIEMVIKSKAIMVHWAMFQVQVQLLFQRIYLIKQYHKKEITEVVLLLQSVKFQRKSLIFNQVKNCKNHKNHQSELSL